MKLALTLLGSLLLMTGCANEHAPPRTAAAIQREPVAAAFCMRKKGIHYEELVYKVLYNETVVHDSVFDGLWDVDSDLSQQWASQLSRVGVRSQSVTDLLTSSELRTSFCSEVEDSLQPVSLPEPIRDQLLKQQVRYLLLLRAPRFSVSSYSFSGGLGQLTIVADLVFQNLQTNKQEYLQHVALSGNVSFGSSPRNLEANDLALLKRTAREWVVRQGPSLIRSALDLR